MDADGSGTISKAELQHLGNGSDDDKVLQGVPSIELMMEMNDRQMIDELQRRGGIDLALA